MAGKRKPCPREGCDGILRPAHVGKTWLDGQWCRIYFCPKCGGNQFVPVAPYTSPSQGRRKCQIIKRKVGGWLKKKGAREI